MAEWESSYGGKFLHNARLLTKEEIQERYPAEDNSRMARLTREFVNKGFDILYGENPELCLWDTYNWSDDILVTAAYLYHTTPDKIIKGGYTDMSNSKAIYAAVRLKNVSDIRL